MDKNEIYEVVIREMTEQALLNHREDRNEKEQQLYAEANALAKQRQGVLASLPLEQRQGAGGLLC